MGPTTSAGYLERAISGPTSCVNIKSLGRILNVARYVNFSLVRSMQSALHSEKSTLGYAYAGLEVEVDVWVEVGAFPRAGNRQPASGNSTRPHQQQLRISIRRCHLLII